MINVSDWEFIIDEHHSTFKTANICYQHPYTKKREKKEKEIVLRHPSLGSSKGTLFRFPAPSPLFPDKI